MVSEDIKNRIVSVINIFETGTPDGEYDNISIYADGKNKTRQITYGRSQTTEQGLLKDLIKSYVDNNGAYADALRPYLSKIGVSSLVNDSFFINTLKKAAQDDAVMRNTQDVFFDKRYYQPAIAFCKTTGMSYPLSMLVVYDSYIHSGGILDFLRARFPEVPPVRGGDEKAWVKAYVNTRHKWLANHSKAILQKTIYRTECMMLQIATGNWMLTKQVLANGTLSRDIDAIVEGYIFNGEPNRWAQAVEEE
jgi:chitosanase